MPEHTNWDERYRTGDLPWDTGEPDKHLKRIIAERPIQPGRALEIGCGTGTNALWLAQQGFEMVAMDVSAVAIELAREKAASQKTKCEFLTADILSGMDLGTPFSFVFDRGCFHSFDSQEERNLYVKMVADQLAAEGLWLSMIGSTDAPPREFGPPRRSALDIVLAVESRFEILWLKAVFFDSNLPEPPRAWKCLMRKRSEP